MEEGRREKNKGKQKGKRMQGYEQKLKIFLFGVFSPDAFFSLCLVKKILLLDP